MERYMRKLKYLEKRIYLACPAQSSLRKRSSTPPWLAEHGRTAVEIPWGIVAAGAAIYLLDLILRNG